MTKLKTKTIEVEAGVNANFLESTLTEDISPLAALFDLIDNSIDAARDHLLKSKHKSDIYGLPNEYSGYAIHLRIDQDSIRVLDNCLGIEEEKLATKTFKIAETSDHQYGIGHYGLGLKRSLLKVGSNYAMTTDNAETLFKMRFDNKSFGASAKKLLADGYISSGKRKVLFSVSQLKSGVKYEISDGDWFKNAIRELSVRYAIYTTKGLKITLRSIIHKEFKVINGIVPTLRKDGKFLPSKKIDHMDGVDIYIESGIHHDYYFPGETNYSLSNNRKLTDEFGVYIVCNDRVIVASSTAAEYGWRTKWHSEYNGFVCWVRFVSKDSGKMPWNTAKTAIRTDSTLFLKVRDQIKPIADSYRADIKRRYSIKKKSGEASPQTHPETSSMSQELTKNSTAPVDTTTQAKDNRSQHTQQWTTLLPKHFNVSNDSVLNSYILEAIDLDISKYPYASALLYRSIIEAALKGYVKTNNNYAEVITHFYSKGEGKNKNHSDEYKKAQSINLSMILAWLLDNSAVFNNDTRLALATKKTKEHIQFLNGVVHCNQLLEAGKLTTIRNDTYPLLEFSVSVKHSHKH